MAVLPFPSLLLAEMWKKPERFSKAERTRMAGENMEQPLYTTPLDRAILKSHTFSSKMGREQIWWLISAELPGSGRNERDSPK